MIHTFHPLAARTLILGIFLLQAAPTSAASVSELEKSLESGKSAKPEAGPILSSNEQLIKALEAAGWDASQTATGDLLLKPRSGSGNAENPTPPQNDRWQKLKQQLEKAGWNTSEDADGSLVLRPPRDTIGQTPSRNPGPLAGMREKLEAAGWRIEETADGSLLLYPPGKDEADAIAGCTGVLTRYRPDLPVDSWQKAYDVAQSWLADQPGTNASVGRIRRILGVHIISIVSSKPPYRLMHQIAIRNSDGAVIVLE